MPQKDMLTYGNLVVTLIIALSILLWSNITTILPKISYTIASRSNNKVILENKKLDIKEYISTINLIK